MTRDRQRIAIHPIPVARAWRCIVGEHGTIPTRPGIQRTLLWLPFRSITSEILSGAAPTRENALRPRLRFRSDGETSRLGTHQ